MGRLTPYEPVLSGKALAFLLSLQKRQQRRLIEALYRLAEYPNQPGDYESTDETGRKVQHLQAGPLVISYWPDSFAQELRITEIDEL